MWIRNQDRTALLDCDNFEVESYSDAPHEVVTLHSRTNITMGLGVYSSKEFGIVCDRDIILGKYSTMKKALKVLDEIQKYIGSERFYSTTKGISEQQSISIENTNVFKMPQDEDVEV